MYVLSNVSFKKKINPGMTIEYIIISNLKENKFKCKIDYK